MHARPILRLFTPLAGIVFTALEPPAVSGASLASPPSSLRPAARTAVVRLSHRHRAVRECFRLHAARSCLSNIAEADTATVVELERTSVTAAMLEPDTRSVRVVFPHHAGPQEQALDLPLGEWVVDWPGADKIERLHVDARSKPRIVLLTVSGACRLRENRCELVPGQLRHVVVSDASQP
jgi:hypothetical protein